MPLDTRVINGTGGLICLYGVAYLFSTEVFHGNTGGTSHRIRLFRSQAHLTVFRPMIGLEEKIRPWSDEFSAQVAGGAALPPPD